jgi:hypothetical protein
MARNPWYVCCRGIDVMTKERMPSMKTILISLPLLALLSATGCSPVFVNLKAQEMAKLKLIAGDAGTATYCANLDRIPTRAVVSDLRGSRYVVGSGPVDGLQGRIKSSELEWLSAVRPAGEDGDAILKSPILERLDRPISLEARLTRHPEIGDRVTLTPRYDCGALVATGQAGKDGSGDPGGPGPTLRVALAPFAIQPGKQALPLRVQNTQAPDSPRYFVLDPNSVYKFPIDASGGRGSAGGIGWPGSDGFAGTNGFDGTDGTGCSNGGAGSAGGNGGDGSDGGEGGVGGAGGPGGTIVVEVDPGSADLVSRLDLRVHGGPGGQGGAGGSGGHGGRGGKGGRGGRGGSIHSLDGPLCMSSDGMNGPDGFGGQRGSSGWPGKPGPEGASGVVRVEYKDRRESFTNEIAHGVPIVLSSSNPAPASEVAKPPPH